jgi:glycosyltransferase involved in cell wall biosynthesis
MIDKQDSLEKVGWDRNFTHVFFLSDPARPEKNYRLASDAFQKLNLKNLQVHFMRGIDHRETVFYYNAADVCLLTSFHEGSPNVIKEAMACGSAIVATSVGDISDLFKDTEGCFISENDSDDVAQKIIEALNYVKEYGKTNGRARIIEMGFDSENIANQVSDVYMKTLGFGS